MPDSLDGFPAVPSNGLGLCCFIHTSVPASAGTFIYPPNRCGRPIRWLRASANRVCHLRCVRRFPVRLRRSGVKKTKRRGKIVSLPSQMALLNLSAPYQSVVRHKPAASRFRRSWYRRVLIHSSFLPVVSEIVRKDRC